METNSKQKQLVSAVWRVFELKVQIYKGHLSRWTMFSLIPTHPCTHYFNRTLNGYQRRPQRFTECSPRSRGQLSDQACPRSNPGERKSARSFKMIKVEVFIMKIIKSCGGNRDELFWNLGELRGAARGHPREPRRNQVWLGVI